MNNRETLAAALETFVGFDDWIKAKIYPNSVEEIQLVEALRTLAAAARGQLALPPEGWPLLAEVWMCWKSGEFEPDDTFWTDNGICCQCKLPADQSGCGVSTVERRVRLAPASTLPEASRAT